MMNYQPLPISRNKKYLTFKKIKYKYKSNKKTPAIQFNHNISVYKNSCYSWTELNTDNSKIGLWSRDLLDMQFKYLFPFFLGLSATMSFPCRDHRSMPWFHFELQLSIQTGNGSLLEAFRQENHVSENVKSFSIIPRHFWTCCLSPLLLAFI